jgi:hypothetical protein
VALGNATIPADAVEAACLLVQAFEGSRVRGFNEPTRVDPEMLMALVDAWLREA